MQLDRAWIAARIPHQGPMCLLDRVVSWDTDGIVCESESHRSSTNPLRARGQLSTIAAVEYAAQCMAVHGALLTSHAARSGHLVSVRALHVHRARIDDLQGTLCIACERESNSDEAMIYGFDITANGERVLDGRMTVMLQTDMHQ